MKSPLPPRRLAPNRGPRKLRVLAIPPPYRAWLTISNDPDNTVISNWNELHRYIWGELMLPFGDALFVRSFNCNLPGQVNLHDNPEIAQAHCHDTLHAWGDYVHARSRGFDRDDALEAVSLLKSHALNPRVWVDHSTHPQNMLHNSTDGSTPGRSDGSRTVYTNFSYTLDLAAELGIRYLWDGRLTSVLGQDTPISPGKWYAHKASSRLQAAFLRVWHWLSVFGIVRWGRSLVTYHEGVNRQYFAHKFADGQTLYCFRRYGTWDDADIDGLAKLICPGNIEELIRRQATCIVYTHLGKRKTSRNTDKDHIPPDTRAELANLRRQYDERALKLSSVSALLDYLVIRDTIAISPKGNWIDFRPDGIRFTQLALADLTGKEFGLRVDDAGRADELEIRISGRKVAAAMQQHEDNCYSVSFPPLIDGADSTQID